VWKVHIAILFDLLAELHNSLSISQWSRKPNRAQPIIVHKAHFVGELLQVSHPSFQVVAFNLSIGVTLVAKIANHMIMTGSDSAFSGALADQIKV